MNTRLVTLLALGLAVAPLSTVAAFAAGSGGDTVPSCKSGHVYDQKSKKCVPQRGGGVIDDESLYSTGRQLALAGKYDEAISVLSLIENKNDARVLNYLGYSHRKAGRLRVGLGYYEEAMQVDPDYTLVREYYGEAQLQMGEVFAANIQLSEIEKRCGTGCAEYKDLAAAIKAFENRG
jgi:tetratricopeptide (TPR) repeat protein